MRTFKLYEVGEHELTFDICFKEENYDVIAPAHKTALFHHIVGEFSCEESLRALLTKFYEQYKCTDTTRSVEWRKAVEEVINERIEHFTNLCMKKANSYI